MAPTASTSPARIPVVGVMGSGSEPHEYLAVPLGRWLAARGVHPLTGGGGGVMRTVSAAFRAVPGRRGLVLGVLPGDPATGAAPPGYPNPAVELVLRTHLPLSGREGTDARSRNHVNVLSADVVVALPGGYGTASEVALARRYGRPVTAFVDARAGIPGLAPDVPTAATLDVVTAFVDAHLRRGGPPVGRPAGAAASAPVRRLTADDAERYQALRLAALQAEPTSFASTYEREAAHATAFVAARLAPDAPASVFGAFDGDALVATAGLLCSDNPKLAHRGELWGVYVAPEARGRGLGHTVCAAALEHGRTRGLRHVILGVAVENASALALYERLGFVAYGLEPGFLVVDGVAHDELLMRMSLA